MTELERWQTETVPLICDRAQWSKKFKRDITRQFVLCAETDSHSRFLSWRKVNPESLDDIARISALVEGVTGVDLFTGENPTWRGWYATSRDVAVGADCRYTALYRDEAEARLAALNALVQELAK